MDLRQYLDAVRKYWWVVVACGLLGGVFGVYGAKQAEPSFRGSVTFFVVTRADPTNPNSAVQQDTYARLRVNSYVALATTDSLARLVVEEADVPLQPGRVRGMLSASGDLDTVLLTVTVTTPTLDLATKLSEAVGTAFVDLVNDVEGVSADSSSVQLEVVSGPNVRQVPTRPTLSVALRGFMGGLLGLGLAVLLHLRDHTVRSQADLDAMGLEPVLGSIPLDRRERLSELFVADRVQTATAESFRHLRTNVQFLDVDRPIHVVVVSSSVPGEGKSFVSRNLALSIAAADLRVLLVEADLRRPTLAEDFGVERIPGLSDVLAGRATLDEALRPWGPSGLTILPSGYLPPNPSELLGSAAASRLLNKLRERFDVVVFDTPPLLPVTDGAVLATLADGVILVVREGKTSRHQLGLSVQRLERVGARLLGSVMNMVVEEESGYSTYDRPTAPALRGEPYDPAGFTPASVETTRPSPRSRAGGGPQAEPRPAGGSGPGGGDDLAVGPGGPSAMVEKPAVTRRVGRSYIEWLMHPRGGVSGQGS